VTDEMLDKMGALGLISVFDVEEVGPEMLETELQATPEIADAIVAACSDKAKIVAEQQAKDREEADRLAAEQSTEADALLGGGSSTDEASEAAADDILGGGGARA
jgi:N utilization substance protein A